MHSAYLFEFHTLNFPNLFILMNNKFLDDPVPDSYFTSIPKLSYDA